ncbi:unnamed protein product [Meloidogyne enterolobii]|uniref:Uncharacterized protein n=1 Tax=Meloidogyne enterolobii TaxID=390850 RepID=A0ACB1A6Q7_MELEN
MFSLSFDLGPASSGYIRFTGLVVIRPFGMRSFTLRMGPGWPFNCSTRAMIQVFLGCIESSTKTTSPTSGDDLV